MQCGAALRRISQSDGRAPGTEPPAGQVTLSDFLADYERDGVGGMAAKILRNRQRIGPRSGTLKAEAPLRFAVVLHGEGIEASFCAVSGVRPAHCQPAASHACA